MPRSTNTPASKRRRKKVFKRAKGFFGGRRKLLRTAKETVQRAMAFSTRDRKTKKRTFRKLWTVRINAACRQCGLTYSDLIFKLKKSNVTLDRKSLADIAVRDTEAFQKIVELVSAK